MAGNDDLSTQLAVQQQINKVLRDRQAMLLNQAKTLGTQAQLAAELCKALECKDLQGLEDRLKGIKDTLGKVSEEAKKAGQSTGDLGNQAEKTDKPFKNMETNILKIASSVGLVKGLQQAFAGTIKTMQGFGRGITSIVSSVMKLSLAILSIPLKIYEGLIGMAQAGGGGPDPVKVQLEEIREQFGSLATNEGKAFMNITAKLQANFKTLGVGGKSLSRLFGYGRGGLAAALKQVQEIATEIGPVFSRMYSQFEKNAEAILKYQKGLKFSSKTMGLIIKQAYRMDEALTGKDGKGVFNRLTHQAKIFADSYKMNHEGVTKAMDDLIQMDYRFQMQAVKTPGKLAAVATKVRLLGIEAKELKGIIDTWDNWDSAIQATSDLGAMFGMNIDAVQMMNASEDERLQIMQDQIKLGVESGKLDMNNPKHLKNLAEASKLQEDTLKAMAKARKGEDMKDINKNIKDQKKETMSQAEAMEYLADSMKQVFGGGGGSKFKGFFDAFIKGFGKGIMRSRDFRKVLRNIRKSLKVVYRAGIEVGKMFVKLFPGMQKMTKGLQNMFDPKRFSRMMKQVKSVFRKFFLDVHKDPKGGVESFVKSMKKIFTSFFGKQGHAARTVAEGGQTFLKTLWGIFKAALFMVVPQITKGLRMIADMIKNPPEINSAFGEMMAALWTEMKEVFTLLIVQLGPPLMDAMMAVFNNLYVRLKPYLEKVFPMLIGALLAKAMFIILLNVAKSALVGKGITLLFKAVMKMIGFKLPGMKKETTRQAAARGKKIVAPYTGIIDYLSGPGSVTVAEIKTAAKKLIIMAVTLAPALITFVMVLVAGLAGAISMMGNPIKFAVGIAGIALVMQAFKPVLLALKDPSMNEMSFTSAAGKMLAMSALVAIGLIPLSVVLAGVAMILSSIDPWSLVGSMLGMSMVVGALALVAKGLSTTNPAETTMAAGILPTMLPLLKTMGLFALGWMIVAPLIAGIGVATSLAAAGVMGAIALVIWAMTALAKPAAALGADSAIMANAMLGVGVAGLLVAEIGLVFGVAAAVLQGSGILDGIDWVKMATAFGAIAIMMAPLALLAWGASLLVADGGVTAGIAAVVGIPVAAGLIWAIGWLMGKVANQVDGMVDARQFIKLNLVMLGMIPLMASLIVVASLAVLGAIPFAAGIIALTAAWGFISMLGETVLPSLTDPVTLGRYEKLGKVKDGFKALEIAMSAMGIAAEATSKVGGFFGIGSKSDQMIELIKGFLGALDEGNPSFWKMMDNMLKNAPADPQAFKASAEGFAAAMNAMARMIEASAALAQIGTGGILGMGAPDPAIFDKVKDIITVIMDKAPPIIDKLMALAGSVSGTDVGKIKAIGALVSSISELFGNLLGPVAEIAQLATEAGNKGFISMYAGTDESTVETVMNSVSGLVMTLMNSMSTNIGPMISAILSTPIPEGDVGKMKAKADLMSVAVDIIATFSGSMAAQAQIVNEMVACQDDINGWWDDGPEFKDMAEQLAGLITILTPVLSRSVPEIIRGMIAVVKTEMANVDAEKFGKKMNAAAQAMTAVSTSMETIDKIDKFLKKKGKVHGTGVSDTIKLYFGDGEGKKGYAVEMIEGLGKTIGAAVGAMLTATKTIPDTKQLKPRMDAVAAGMSAVTGVLGAIQGLLGLKIGGSAGPQSASEVVKAKGKEVVKYVEGEKPVKDVKARTAKLKDAVLEIVGVFTDPNGGIKTIFNTIMDMVKDPALNNFKNVGEKVGIIKEAIGTVGTFMKSIQAAIKLIPADEKTTAGQLKARAALIFGHGEGKTGADAQAGYEESVFGMIMKQIRWGLPAVLDDISTVVRNLPSNFSKSTVETLVAAMEILVKFSDAMVSIMGMVGGGDAGKRFDLQGGGYLALKGFFEKDGAFGAMIDAIAGKGDEKGGLERMVTMITGIKVPRGSSGRIVVIKDAMCAVQQFATIVSTIGAAFPNTMPPGGEGPAVDGLKQMAAVVTGVKVPMEDMIKDVLVLANTYGGQLYAARTRLVYLTRALTIVQKFAEVLSSLAGAGGLDPATLIRKMNDITAVFTPGSGPTLPGMTMSSPVGAVVGAIAKFAQEEVNVKDMETATTKIKAANKAMTQVQNMFKAIPDAADTKATQFMEALMILGGDMASTSMGSLLDMMITGHAGNINWDKLKTPAQRMKETVVHISAMIADAKGKGMDQTNADNIMNALTSLTGSTGDSTGSIASLLHMAVTDYAGTDLKTLITPADNLRKAIDKLAAFSGLSPDGAADISLALTYLGADSNGNSVGDNLVAMFPDTFDGKAIEKKADNLSAILLSIGDGLGDIAGEGGVNFEQIAHEIGLGIHMLTYGPGGGDESVATMLANLFPMGWQGDSIADSTASFANIVFSLSNMLAALPDINYNAAGMSIAKGIEVLAYGPYGQSGMSMGQMLSDVFPSGWSGADVMSDVLFLTQIIPALDYAFSNVGNLLPEKVKQTANAIATMDGILSGKHGSATARVLKGFEGGKLVVDHNLPNTTLKINVTLKAEDIAKAITTVSLGDGKTVKATGTGGR